MMFNPSGNMYGAELGGAGLGAGTGFTGLGAAAVNYAPGLGLGQANAYTTAINPGLGAITVPTAGYQLAVAGPTLGGFNTVPVQSFDGFGIGATMGAVPGVMDAASLGGAGMGGQPGLGGGAAYGGGPGVGVGMGHTGPRPRPRGGGTGFNYGGRQSTTPNNLAGATGGKQRMDETFIQGKIFLGGLSPSTTNETLKHYCSRWGDLADIVVMTSRGFGFVTYANPIDAQSFLDTRDHVIDGRHVEAKAAVPKNAGGSQSVTKKMFVGGTGSLTDQDLFAYFSQYGQIVDAAIVRVPATGQPRGFAFVTFNDEMAVEKCLVIAHCINGQNVDLRRAVPREGEQGYTGGSGRGRGGAGAAAAGAGTAAAGGRGGYGRGARGGAVGAQRFRPY